MVIVAVTIKTTKTVKKHVRKEKGVNQRMQSVNHVRSVKRRTASNVRNVKAILLAIQHQKRMLPKQMRRRTKKKKQKPKLTQPQTTKETKVKQQKRTLMAVAVVDATTAAIVVVIIVVVVQDATHVIIHAVHVMRSGCMET